MFFVIHRLFRHWSPSLRVDAWILGLEGSAAIFEGLESRPN